MISPARHRLAASGIALGSVGRSISPGAVALIAAGWKPPVGCRPPNAPGAPRVTRVPGSWAGSGMGDAVWSLVDIEQQQRPIRGLDGAVLQFQNGTPVAWLGGGTIRQWCDLPLASACVAQARKALNDAIASQNSTDLQFVAVWLAAAYSAANIPWQTDPSARLLWRRYMSGDAASLGARFSGSQNWNACCTTANNFGTSALTPDANPARVYVGTGFTGSLPADAYAVFRRCKPTANVGQFTPQFWIGQDVGAGGETGASTLGPNRDNDTVLRTSMHLQNYAESRAGRFGYVTDAACNRLAPGAGPIVWDAFGFDGDWVGDAPPLRFGERPSAYVAFLSAWLDALESRTAAQVVLDARTFATYLNEGTIQANGASFNAAAQRIATTQLAEWTPDTTAQNVVNVVRVGAPAIGAVVGALAAVAAGAASAATLGIGAIIIGAITATAAIAGALIQPDPSNLYLDDLLRARPMLERAYLDGDPGTLSNLGAPVNIVVGTPPDFSRYAATPIPSQPVLAVPTTASSGGGLATGVVLVGGGVALAQWAGLINLGRYLGR